MRQRHKPHKQKYPDFVCMRILLPNKLHSEVLQEQERLHESGVKKSIQDLMVGIVKDWSKNKEEHAR